MSQCLKVPVQTPEEPSIPTWAEYLHPDSFTSTD